MQTFAAGGDAAFLSTCPVRGTTLVMYSMEPVKVVFLSTCPVRGTTRRRRAGEYPRDISIHVPREGHDLEAKT